MRVRWGAVGVAVLVVLGASVLVAPPAAACSCVGLEAGRQFGWQPDAAFVGTRVEDRAVAGSADRYQAVIQVEEVFVGEVHRREALLAWAGPGPGCGVTPLEEQGPTRADQGELVGVLAERRADGMLEVSLCSFVDADVLTGYFKTPEDEWADDVAAMTEGARVVEGDGPGVGREVDRAPWFIAGAAGLLLVLVVLAGVVVGLRRRTGAG